jgi:shikimate kinase / 3-dehydroquinate synthase
MGNDPPVHALSRHIALIGFMGAGKSTLGAEVARRLDRPFVDLDRELEHELAAPVGEIFETRGEATFREAEEELTVEALVDPVPGVLALGGGALGSERTREALRERALAVLVEIEPGEAWRRVGGSGRPLARDEASFRALYEERRPLYDEAADAQARDADDVVLAAGGVHVELGALESLGDLVPGTGPVALVADARVAGIHGTDAQLALGARLAGTHELPEGEDAKTVVACERLWSELRLDRGGTLVALGGGCTSDAAGFAAATYLRGVAWAPVPTTLVGQVDAAIGGKTALNLPAGKNLVGAFHWPVCTVVDPALLETLPERERREGMSEVVKTGLLAGEPLWELPERELVRRCAAFKTAVCLRDPLDRGPRAQLNLGHTFAHALEAAGGYAGPTHGEAVALGLLAALRLSGNDEAARTVREVLRPQPARVDADRAWQALLRDKKGRLRLVLLPTEGGPLVEEVDEAAVRRALAELVAG